MADILQSFSNDLLITDAFTHNCINVFIEDDLDISDVFQDSSIYIYIIDTIILTQEMLADIPEIPITLVSEISLSHSIHTTEENDFEHTIILTDKVDITPYASVIDTLHLTQEMLAEDAKGPFHTLELTDVMGVTIEMIKALTDDLDLSHSMLVQVFANGKVVDNACQTDILISRQIVLYFPPEEANVGVANNPTGHSIGTTTIPVHGFKNIISNGDEFVVYGSATIFTISGHIESSGKTISITFSPPLDIKLIPYAAILIKTVSLTDYMFLRRPAFSDRDSVNVSRIYRESRQGTLRVSPTIVPVQFDKLNLNFREITENLAQTLLLFLTSTVGLRIGLFDHECRNWFGFITNPDNPITQTGPSSCSYDASFSFEGEQQ